MNGVKEPLNKRSRTPNPRVRNVKRQNFHILEGAALGLSALIITAVFFASFTDQFVLRSGSFAAVVSATLTDLTNADRANASLPSLKVNPVLVAAAQAKADDEAAKSYFAHTSPEGLDSWHWFKLVNYDFVYAGENLAVHFSDSSDVEQAWMNSDSHRKNILDPHFTEIGIATASGMYEGRPTVFVVQMFGYPATSPRPGAPVTITKAKEPTEIAIATTKVVPTSTPASVLGAVSTEPTATLESASSEQVSAGKSATPWWYFYLAAPRTTLSYVYYFFAFIIIGTLLFTTGFEIHVRHLKKAAGAGLLLGLMCGLFLILDHFVFVAPIVAGLAK